MVTRESFLAALSLQPEDDAARLVFSDWLEEHGEPDRAEFVRVQLALTKMAPDDPGRFDAERREAELLAAHREPWIKDLPRWAQKEERIDFRRGFVAELSLTEKRFLDRADELFAVTPLEAVRLRRVTRDLEALSSSLHLSRLRKLDLTRNVLDRGGIVRLVTAGAPNLSDLILDENRADGECVRSLLESDHLPRLQRLSLRRSLMGNQALHRVAETPNASRLRALVLRDNVCADDGVAALAASPHLTNLCDLDLGYTQITTAALANLAGSPLLAQLRRLELASNFTNIPRAAETLAAQPHRLTELGLSHTHTTDEGLIALANSPASAHLRVLNLYCCEVKTAGVAALARSPHLSNLTHLNLGHNFLDAAGIEALAESPYLGKVVLLQVSFGRGAETMKGRLIERFGGRVRS